jgi:hypothetical protein
VSIGSNGAAVKAASSAVASMATLQKPPGAGLAERGGQKSGDTRGILRTADTNPSSSGSGGAAEGGAPLLLWLL